MKKKYKILIALLGSVLLLVAIILNVHNSLFDRINPFISEETSIARVKKNARQYVNVHAENKKTGASMTIEHITGFDRSKEYIEIDHKGQYVKEIIYISKEEYERLKTKTQKK